jgi:hypothetical protein
MHRVRLDIRASRCVYVLLVWLTYLSSLPTPPCPAPFDRFVRSLRSFVRTGPITYFVSKACLNRATALLAAGAPPLDASTLLLVAQWQRPLLSAEEADVFAALSNSTTTAAFRVVVNAVHPGHVRSKMGGFDAPTTRTQGAAAVVRAALLTDDRVTGQYFQPDGTVFPNGWE